MDSGMEVYVSNVAEQASETALSKFLKPFLVKLSIQSVHCQKSRGKRFAFLTFLHVTEGQKFMAQYGQTKDSAGRFQPLNRTTFKMMFQNQPLYFTKAKEDANPHHLRVLAKEEKDRNKLAQLAISRYDNPRNAEILPVIFEVSSIDCGVWSYVNSYLVFSPQVKLAGPGTARFGEMSMILKLDSGKRVDFRYPSTLVITTQAEPNPSLVISMQESPLFFETIPDDTIARLMSQLGIQPLTSIRTRKNGPNRHRLPQLGGAHENIAGNCLVWRINLRNDTPASLVGKKVGDIMSNLHKAHGLPNMLWRQVEVSQWGESYAAGAARLHEALSSMNINLPYKLIFQIQRLSWNNYLSPATVLSMLPEIARMAERSPMSVSVGAIRALSKAIDWPGPYAEAEYFQLSALIDHLRICEERLKRGIILQEESLSGNVAMIHRAKVTPTGITLSGPEQESNNRVLRKYSGSHEYFIRVQFFDEDGRSVMFSPKISNERIFNGRFKKILDEGINIAGREYTFLGFSHSSLRAQTCWFVAPFIHDGSLIYDQVVIDGLGDFSLITSPAKRAARIGQAFSDTSISVTIDPIIVEVVADVERNGRCFSDGAGTMSQSVMCKIWDKLPKEAPRAKPTCFQIRYSGAKGMISLDSRLQGDVLRLRPSMVKFNGTNTTDLEICEGAWKPLPCFLNRQLIKIMEDLGVDESWFLDLQAKEIKRLRDITNSPYNASTFLKRQSIGEAVHLSWLLNKLSVLNLDFREDHFLRHVIEMALLFELRQLKHKTRIPVQKGWHLHGIMDETGVLEEGQIFCNVCVEGGHSQVLIGKDIIISRAPCLHPGDVRQVDAVYVPPGSPLRMLHNCIVFSQKGQRDLPSQLSGGDLDGDRYYIIWDEKAHLKRIYPPAEYARQPPVDLGRPVTRTDLSDFFIEFMKSDQLGRIAVLHRVLADLKDDGTLDDDCITLAEMHSTAVDFSKTGIPVDMSMMPKYPKYRPDFEAPGPHVHIEKKGNIVFEDESTPDEVDDDDDEFKKYRYYESDKVLGKLYRAIDERKIFQEIQERSKVDGPTDTSAIIQDVWEHVQNKCELIQWDHLKETARDIRDAYEEGLQGIMTEYSDHPQRPITELEAFIGNIFGSTGAQTKRQRDLSTTMKERFDENAANIVNMITRDEVEHSEEALERSMACLAISLEDRSRFGKKDQLLSFKYVAAAVCLREVDRAGL